MQLNIHNVCEYLLDKNYIRPDEIFTSGFYITEESRRNKNFLIRKGNKTGILLKQVRAFDSTKTYSIHNEAKIYWLAHKEKCFSDFKSLMPEFYGFDTESHILGIELFLNYYDLLHYYESNNNFIDTIPKKQAAILHSYHNKLDFSFNVDINSLFHSAPPWIFHIPDAKPHEVNLVSKADYEIFHRVRLNHFFCEKTIEIRNNWKANSIIHGDIKMPNFLVNHLLDIRLIDWEMVQIGDALWDVAGVFNDYFIFWNNIKYKKDHSLSQYIIPNLFQSLNIFWHTYNINSRLLQSDMITLAHYTALRIIQTCIEYSHFKQSLDNQTLELLDLSFQLMHQPLKTISYFINIKS